MFKFFALFFAAILALAVAAPKPGIVAPLAYSAAPYTISGHVAAPLAYSAYAPPVLSYAHAPLIL